jgi:uncharacterized protein
MEIEYDPIKRDETLAERGLDFRDAPKVLEGAFQKTIADVRFDYGEDRMVTFGWLGELAVAVVWTDRGSKRRIISMRRMHDEEIEDVGLDRP